MRIKQLKLSNFRNLQDYQINFDENLTVLVANNGAGKTAILDALTVALGTFIGVFPSGINKGFKPSDATVSKNTNSVEVLFPIKLSAMFMVNNNDLSVNRQLSSAKSKTTRKETEILEKYAKNLLNAVRKNEPITLPVISYYGTARLWSQIKLTKKSLIESKSRTFAYHDCLYPESSYKEFEQWFIDQSIAEYDEIVNYYQKTVNQGVAPIVAPVNLLLQSVRIAIDKALQQVGWSNLRYSGETKDITVENGQTRITVSLLSDGVKNMLAMVGDIAYRCAKLNPHLLTNSNQCAGIVLIDEIDMHLHPRWQQSVLNSLRQIFSNIQFIVTTHSPQILSTVKKCNIRVIDPSLTEALIPEVNPYGQASIVALEDIMNVKSIPIAVVAESRLLDKYLKIINSGDIFNTDLPAMREQLEQVFGVNNQKLMIADMMINKFKALQK